MRGILPETLQLSLRVRAAAPSVLRKALNDTRRDIARSYLDEGHTSVTEIAFLLGLADTSGFPRAFRRWTGLSPRAYTHDRARTRSRAS